MRVQHLRLVCLQPGKTFPLPGKFLKALLSFFSLSLSNLTLKTLYLIGLYVALLTRLPKQHMKNFLVLFRSLALFKGSRPKHQVKFLLTDQTCLPHDSIFVTGTFSNWDSKHNLKYLFKPAGQKRWSLLFTTKPTGQGIGLGLSIRCDIVKAHSGELSVETTQREGSEFIIHLPATRMTD